MTLPEGWTSEVVYREQEKPERWVLITAHEPRGGGMVTLDLELRCYRSGFVVTGRATSTKKYAGRGWKEQLTRDAVRWLQGVLR